jgi:phage FluMu protein Com
MPIKFACEHCGARLSVSSRKAGAQAKCPKCQRVLEIPALERGEAPAQPVARDEPSGAIPAAGPPGDDPLAQFLVYDSESELIYATEDEENPSQAGFRASLDPHKVAVPRAILYMQGALLGLVALMSLLIGILLGRGCSPAVQIADEGPQACQITGVVAIQDARGETTPDGGAVVVVVPRDLRPEQQASMLGLRPQDPLPDENHAGLQALYELGADYARADAEGRFQLRVPNRGNYYLLVISAHASQDDRDQPKTTLAQIGRFFQLTPNMFEGHAIRWQEENVQRDRQLNIVFLHARP